MAYGKIKADTFVYDNSGSDVEITVSSLGNKANLNSPTFTGTPVVPGYAPLAGATFTGNVVMSANLTVQGTTTTISSTTIEVADKNLELGKVSTPTDTTADGGGITLKGATDKTWNWVNATDSWTSSEHINVGDSKKLLLGTGSDLQIYHDGTHNRIDSTNGMIYLRHGTDNALKTVPNGTVELYYDDSKKLETTTAGVTVTGTCTATTHVVDSKGNVRDIIQNTQSSAYTLVGGDAGKHILISSGGVTVPGSVYGAGNAVTIINNSGSDQTITQGSGITMYNTADAATGNRTLAARGMATILFTSGSAAYISGAGLS